MVAPEYPTPRSNQCAIIKQSHSLLLNDLGKLLVILADIAENSKNFVMPGRTHGQHAVPVTFGYKVAVWIDELVRHVERLKNCEP